MNASPSPIPVEAAWRLYLRALTFLLPGLGVWAYAVKYLHPKVQVLWRHGGDAAPNAQWLMDAVDRLVQYGWIALAAVAVAAIVGRTAACRLGAPSPARGWIGGHSLERGRAGRPRGVVRARRTCGRRPDATRLTNGCRCNDECQSSFE
jgi:hypothetical protein